jgi:hypothetical protein
MLSLGIAGFVFAGIPRGRRRGRTLAICAIIGVGIIATSCGGVSSAGKATTTATPAAVTYAVTINGNSGSNQFSTSINVTVQ